MISRQCEQCGQDFDVHACFVRYGGGRFCSKSCKTRHRWATLRNAEGYQPKGYRREARPEHPLADEEGIVYVHRAALYDKIGPGAHPCHWCGITVTWQSYKSRGSQTGVLVTDHIDGNRQNNDPSNLVPSCFNCNKNRGLRNRKPQTNAVRDDELFLVDKHGWRHRAAQRICEACGTEFLRELAALKTPGTGRFCSRACSGASKRKAATAQTSCA